MQIPEDGDTSTLIITNRKLSMTKAQPKDACAFCHIQSAQKDEVWTQFYQILQKSELPGPLPRK